MNSETICTGPNGAEVAQPTPPPFETLTYSVAEAALILGVSLATIYRLIARRLLRPLPGLRHKRLPKRQVHAYLDSGQPLSV